MTIFVSTERIFSMPCIEGLRLYLRYRRKYPGMPSDDLLSLIDMIEVDARSLDMEASVHLSTFFEVDCPLDGPIFYRKCIKTILLKHQPIWSKAMGRGRKRFVNSLNSNNKDVFSAAGLMDEPVPSDVVAWWDGVSEFGRLITNQEKMEQARAAEMLTLERERARLKASGIKKEPGWPGLDDNYAGYDVLSYDHGPTGVVNHLIEVKSTTVSPLRFFVSRNEWIKAEKTGEAYIFHVWDMKKTPPILHIRTVAEVAPHIPTDNGKGRWSNAEIPVV